MDRDRHEHDHKPMTIQTINPATGRQLASYPFHDNTQVDQILEHAQRACRTWSSMQVEDRVGVLERLSAAFRDQIDDLASLVTTEMGKPVREARAEVEKCARTFQWYADHAPELLREEIVDRDDVAAASVAFRPLGVVLAIMPWNFPLWQVTRAAAPVIASGNAVVLKHAENVTGTALALAHLFEDSGTPDGLFGALLVRVEEIERIIGDDRIAAVTLTGSTRAGRAVASIAGHYLKKTVLELGGSDPFIVLEDADVRAAASVAAKSRFQNAGQSCIAAKRMIVVDAVAPEFIDHFLAATERLVVGDPMQESTDIGPMARMDLRDEVARQVRASVEAGGRIITGGKPLDQPGSWYLPTLIDNVAPGMPVLEEEVFGPVAPLVRVTDAEEAITEANRTRYGLGAAIWTRDLGYGRGLASRLAAGSVTVNGMTASDPRMPFGGIKESGYGRELASYGLKEFVNAQAITVLDPSAERS